MASEPCLHSNSSAQRFAVIVLLATVVTGRNVVAQANLKAGLTDSPGLSARLTNAIVQADNSIELDFVLHNSSSVPIQLAERWNSWGAYQWRFRVVDAKGTAYELGNPKVAWLDNGLTTFTIRPSEEQITPCRLDMSTTSYSEGETAIFTLPFQGYASPRTNEWMFPITVMGVFRATTDTWLKAETTWEGTITTKPLAIGK